MWTADRQWLGIFILVIATACLGTWPNIHRFVMAKRPKANPLILFVNFIASWALWQFIVAFTAGNLGPNEPDLWENLSRAKAFKAVYAWIGGGCSVWGSFLIMEAVPMCGQVLSFPIMVGTAISLGTIVTYKISPNGNLHWLIVGTAVALFAVIAGAISSWERARHHIVEIGNDLEKRKSTNADELMQQQAELDQQVSLHRSMIVRGIVLSLLAGIVFSGWIALSVLSQQGSGCTPEGNRNCPAFEGLSPYGALFWFTIGNIFWGYVGVPLLLLLPINPTIEPVNPISAYLRQSKFEHILMLLGGIFPAAGISGTFMAGPKVGYAPAYVILNSNPLLVSLFGIFVWKEFHNTNFRTKVWFGLMCLGFVLSLIFVVIASGKGKE